MAIGPNLVQQGDTAERLIQNRNPMGFGEILILCYTAPDVQRISNRNHVDKMARRKNIRQASNDAQQADGILRT